VDPLFVSSGDLHLKPQAGRPGLYCDDRTHLGARGHALVVETVLKAIAAGQ
jgi:hypothetical protein